MAEAVATSTVRWVFGRLGSMAAEEWRSLEDVGEDLEKLRSTLEAIRNVLDDAEARQVKEKAIAGWLRKLKDVAFDIDDVLDEIPPPEHMPDQCMCGEMVRKCLSFLESLKFRHERAKKIKQIRKRLDMISEEKSRYNLREGVTTEHSEAIMTRETGSYVDKSQVYGRDEEEKQIIDFLLHKCNEQNLGVISIVGLGGLGKTTLARSVYNDDVQLSEHFETKMWVYVSVKFDIKNVIASMLESITKKKPALSSSTDLIEQELLEHIKGKRFLLVLDDIWIEKESGQRKRLQNLLENGAKGSKVIVTTRSAGVADVMKSDQKLSLRLLPDDECWKLFEKHAFKSDDDAKNRNLVAIGKEIVKKCGGLPLAAEAIGSTLYNKREETWRAVRDNEIWTRFEDDNEILPALMLSYNHLSPPLKQCFAYCSIFPKGFEIEIEMLIPLWIAEGFVDSSEASQYVDRLISRSLLEKVVTNARVFFKKDAVKMHDMVHNLAQFIAGDECSIVDTTSGNNTNFPPKSRYASLVLNNVTPSITRILSSAQKLRTFHMMTIIRGHKDISHRVLETIVSNMQLLRALHLPHLLLEKLPAAITKLSHLRYLDLSYATSLKSLPKTIGLLRNLQTLKLNNTELVTLPESIGDLVELLTLKISCCYSLHSLPSTLGTLQRLQILDLSDCEKLKELPESIGSLNELRRLDLDYCSSLQELPKNIESMRSLTHLGINGCHSLTSMPAWIGRFSQLRMLPMYVLSDGENSASLAELGTLTKLEGPLCIKNLQNVTDVAEASATNLREKQGINSLGLEWDFYAILWENGYEGIDDFENKRKELIERVAHMDGEHVRLLEDVTRNLEPHRNLQRLQIKGYVGNMLPGWMMDLSNLVELHLFSFARCDNLQALEELSCLEDLALKAFPSIECLPRLGQLPRLRALRLLMLPGIKRLGSEFYGGAAAFPALEDMELGMMLGLEEWCGNSINDEGDDSLSRFSCLILKDCPKLRALPPTVLASVERLDMNVEDELRWCYLERGAFSNLNALVVCNCVDTKDEVDRVKARVQQLHPIPRLVLTPAWRTWNHSELELEKMRMETLERIATEIENKLVIQPSSSSA